MADGKYQFNGSPPCGGGEWIGFYKAVPPQEEE